jgi:hypothetical protein
MALTWVCQWHGLHRGLWQHLGFASTHCSSSHRLVPNPIIVAAQALDGAQLISLIWINRSLTIANAVAHCPPKAFMGALLQR